MTFDDGYRNNLTLAADVLKRQGIPCVFHVSTGYIGTGRVLWTDEVISRLIEWPQAQAPDPDGGHMALPSEPDARRKLARAIKERCKRIAWEQLLRYLDRLRQVPVPLDGSEELFGFMSWDEVRALRKQGFDIGSHTIEHPILTRLTPERLQFELTESKRRIEQELGAPCEVIAYPNGGRADFSEGVMQAAKRAGYRLGFTIIERFTDKPENAFAVNRLCIQGHLPLSDFEFRVSGISQVF
jgi:peptidoglycan/xylan/chitin deacetylase (PgdA/CDA1 family)